MQRHTDLTLRRLHAFLLELEQKIYLDVVPVNISVYSTTDRIAFNKAINQNFTPASVGDEFGPAWSTHWFKVGIQIPVRWKGNPVHFLWDSSSEACVWVDNLPLQGLTGTQT